MIKPTIQLNKLISRIKGEPYELDERIELAYLGFIVLERSTMRLRGLVRLPRTSTVFLGSKARIRSASKMRLGSGVTFGRNCYVDATSTDGVSFGNNVSVGRNTRIECTGNLKSLGRGIRVGDNVGLGTDSFYGCAGGIVIGSDTLVGNFVSFHSENHNVDRLDVPIRLQGVSHQGIVVGSNCWIGAKATILDGAKIGDGCVIAAGAVVAAGEYPNNGIYGGAPARLLKMRA